MARFILAIAGAWLAVAALPSPVQAARLLKLNVSRDGVPVLELMYSDDGTARSGTVWRSVGGEPGGVELAEGIEPDEPDGLSATLTGDIEAVVNHSNSPLFTVRVDRLRLVRTSATSNDWYIPSNEIERVAQLTGIPPAATLRPLDPISIVFVAMLVLFAMLVLAITFWLILRRKSAVATDR